MLVLLARVRAGLLYRGEAAERHRRFHAACVGGNQVYVLAANEGTGTVSVLEVVTRPDYWLRFPRSLRLRDRGIKGV